MLTGMVTGSEMKRKGIGRGGYWKGRVMKVKGTDWERYCYVLVNAGKRQEIKEKCVRERKREIGKRQRTKAMLRKSREK